MPTLDLLPVIAPKPPKAERRACARAQVRLWVDAEWAGGFLTEDVGPFGFAVKEGPSLRRGAKLAVSLHVPGEREPLRAMGEVVGAYEAGQGMRVALRSPPLAVAGRLHRLVQQHCSPLACA